MGLFDFLMVESKEKAPAPKYSAVIAIDGRQFPVTTLGIGSVIVGNASSLKNGQTVAFDLALKDPKESLALRGSGLISAERGQTKISYTLPEQQKLAVARFLARYITR